MIKKFIICSLCICLLTACSSNNNEQRIGLPTDIPIEVLQDDIEEPTLIEKINQESNQKDSDVIHNEVVVGDETETILEDKNNDVSLTTYETGSIGIDLKVGDDGKQHGTKVHPLLTLNQNCSDYENLRNTISGEKDEDIVMLFQNIVSKYTLEDLKTKEIKDSIHNESLTELQKLYGTTNFIIDLALGFEFN